MNLRQIVEEDDTQAGRVFDRTIQILVVASIIAFPISTLPKLSHLVREILQWFEFIVVVLFTIEYGLRIYVSEHRLRFVTSFFGIVDLIAILPYYLGVALDLRSVRIIRIMRVLRLLKLTRYSRAVQRMHRALTIVREELILFGGVALVVLYLSTVGIYYFERDAQPDTFASIFHSLWWAIATLTTVGYGDAYPVTMGGRLFTFLVLVLGVGVIAVPTSLLASALSQARREDARREAEQHGADEGESRAR